MENLFDKISEGIKKAMLAKDKARLEALRGAKKELLEAKTAKGASSELTDEQVIKILQKMTKQAKDAAKLFKEQNRDDLASEYLEQVKVWEEYLPAQMSKEELEAEIKKIIAQVGATTVADLGKVMGVASKALAGKADGREISQTVKTLLS